MKIKPVFDVVISTAGRFDKLELCLNSIYKYATIPITITVIDDACNKEEKSHYKNLIEYDPEKDVNKNGLTYTTYRNETAEGFGGSYNRGAKKAHSPFLTILNDDIELHEGYFDKVFEDMQDSTIGVVGSRLLFPDTSTSKNRPAGKIQHIGISLNIKGGVTHPLIGWSPENPRTQISREVFATTGALFTTRTQLFHNIGGFDPIYGLGYFEDVDYCLKVRQKGFRIWLDSNASGTHYANATSEKNPTAFGNQFQRNAMIFRARWGDSLVCDDFTYG